MNRELYEKVRQYVYAQEENIVKDLFTLCAIPSVKSAPLPLAPFGKECRRALDASVRLFQRNGFEAEVKGDGLYALANYGEGERSIGIFAHTDVVGVNDDWLYTSPFKPVKCGNTLVGRGIEDNKAGVIGALYALKAIKECEIPMKHPLTVFLGSEEESGMQDIEAFVKNEPMPAVSFVPDNAYPLCVGEKSIARYWIRSAATLSTITAVEGGFAYNVILDNVTVTMRKSEVLYNEIAKRVKDREEFTLALEEDCVRFTARGLTAHASIPECATNALLLAFDVLKEVPVFSGEERKIMSSAAEFIRNIDGSAMGIGVEDAVFGKLTAANGMVKMKDGSLYISFDIRYGARQDDAALLTSLKETIRPQGWKVEGFLLDKGAMVDPDSPLISALGAVYREVSGDEEAKPYLSGGGTYARKLVNAFSIGTAAPWHKIDLLLPDGHGGAHQSDEAISLPGLLDAIALNVMMMVEGDALVD